MDQQTPDAAPGRQEPPEATPAAPAAAKSPPRPPPGFDPAKDRDYHLLRRRRVVEHAEEDKFIAYLGVTIALAVAGFLAYRLLRPREPELLPLALNLLFEGRAERLGAGRVRVAYDFTRDAHLPEDAEHDAKACPQSRDWRKDGYVLNRGFLFSRENAHLAVFQGRAGDELSVECDLAMLAGATVALCLQGRGPEQDRLYAFELSASRGPGWPPLAQLREMRGEDYRRVSKSVPIPEFRASSAAPGLWFRVRLELAGDEVRGWFQGRQLCAIPAGDFNACVVRLVATKSECCFDDVAITGRPDPAWVRAKSKLRRQIYPKSLGKEPPPPEGC